MDMPEVEEIKKNSERKVLYLPTMNLSGEDIEPYVLITMKDNKVFVWINNTKVYRVLSNKNRIEQALDILMVDTIKGMLDGLAKREEQVEEDFKKGGGEYGKIPKSGRDADDDRGNGQGGTSSSRGIV